MRIAGVVVVLALCALAWRGVRRIAADAQARAERERARMDTEWLP